MFDFYFNIVFVLLVCPNCCVRSFGLTQKNQKVKAASAELLRHFVTLCAPQTRLRFKQRRSGRSTSFLRLTLTRTRPKQLTIDDWQFSFSLAFIHGTCLATVEAQRAAPHNDVLHNPITINKKRMGLLCYLLFYPVALGWRRSTLLLYTHFPNSTGN